MILKYLVIYSLISFSILSTVGCSKPNLFQQNDAQAESSKLYEEGSKYFLGKDYQKAFSYFQMAAQKGLPIAQNDLAGMYFKGIGIQKNEKEAYFWYEKSAKNNFAEAQYNLANIYSDGSLIKQNNEKALELYTKVAKKGVPKAQNNLAYMYANVYLDYEKAKFWFQKAADNGYVPAKEALEQLQ